MIKCKDTSLTKEFIKDIILSALLMLLGALGVARGYTWIVYGDEVLNSAKVYKEVAKFFPIQTLGLVFFIGGAMVILSAFTKGKFAYWSLTIGAFLSSICGSVMYMASTIDSINLYTPLSVGIILAGNIILTVAGVMLLWIEKKKQTM